MLKVEKEVLTADTEKVIPLNSQRLTIYNFGPGSVYIEVDATATTENLEIPEGLGRSFGFGYVAKNVHVIGDDAAKIQIDGN